MTKEVSEKEFNKKVKTQKFKGVKNEAVKCKPKKTPKAPKHLFKLHTVAVFVGNIGSGKTNAVSLEIQAYNNYGSFNRTFIISPTYEYNDPLKLLGADKKDIYTDRLNALSAIADIKHKILEMKYEYEEAVEYKIAYKAWKKGMDTPKQFAILQRANQTTDTTGFKKPPKHIPWPSPCLVIDDMSHSDIYGAQRSNDFVNLVLTCRHIHGIGCSLFLLLQSFKTGAQKVVRQNARQFHIFPTHDYSQLKSMYEDLASVVSYEDFISLYKCAIDGNKHNFLTIDMTADDEKKKTFRRNFDEFIWIEGMGVDGKAEIESKEVNINV